MLSAPPTGPRTTRSSTSYADGCGGIARNAQGSEGCGDCTGGQLCGLGDEAASYVEQHPGVIEKLAGGLPDRSTAEASSARRAQIRDKIRTRLREAREFAASAEGRAAADAFLARYHLSR